MPYLSINDANLYYEETGSSTETIVFSHSLLFSMRIFDDQIDALKGQYRCIAFDFRGQGKSAVSESGYDMDTLTEDAAGLIKTLEAGPCHFIGLSMGGFIGLRLAIRYPELLKSLVLLDSSFEPEPESNLPKYNLLTFIAQYLGLRPVAGRVMPIMFGKEFLEDKARKDLRLKWKQELLANDRVGVIRAVNGVLSREGLTEEALAKITAPTLVMVGEQDVATVPEKSEKMRSAIPDAQLRIIPRAGHISTVEEPEIINQILKEFLEGI